MVCQEEKHRWITRVRSDMNDLIWKIRLLNEHNAFADTDRYLTAKKWMVLPQAVYP